MPSTPLSSTAAGLIQLGVLVLLLAAVYVPFGNYLAAVYTDGRHWRVERTEPADHVLHDHRRSNPRSTSASSTKPPANTST